MSTRSINNERTKRKFTGASGSDDKKKSADGTEEATTSQQFYTGRRTGASAKPSREKAAGVKIIPSSDSARYDQKRAGMRSGTKAERKAKRQEVRSHDDMVEFVGNYLMHKDPSYAKMRRTWWIMLGVGFLCVLLAWAFTLIAGNTHNQAFTVPAFVFMVLSYVLIIAAVVFDFWKIGKMRKKYNAEVHGYTDKKLRRMVQEEEREREAYIAEHGDGLWQKFKRLFR